MKSRQCCDCAYYVTFDKIISRPTYTYNTFWQCLFKKPTETIKSEMITFEMCKRFLEAGMDTLSARGYFQIDKITPWVTNFVNGPCGIDGKYFEEKETR